MRFSPAILAVMCWTVIFSITLTVSMRAISAAGCRSPEQIAGHDAYNPDVCAGISAEANKDFAQAISFFERALARPLFERPNAELLPRLVDAYLSAGRTKDAGTALAATELVFLIDVGVLKCSDENAEVKTLERPDGQLFKGSAVSAAFDIMCNANAQGSSLLITRETAEYICKKANEIRKLKHRISDTNTLYSQNLPVSEDPGTPYLDELFAKTERALSQADFENASNSLQQLELAVGVSFGYLNCRSNEIGNVLVDAGQQELTGPFTATVANQMCRRELVEQYRPVSFDDIERNCNQLSDLQHLKEELRRAGSND